MFAAEPLMEILLTRLSHRTVLRLFACCISALWFTPSGAQTSNSAPRAEHYLQQQRTAQQLFKTNQLAAYASHLQAMSEEYPYKSNLLPRLAAAYVQLGDEEKANQTLQRFAQMGGTLAFRDPNLKQLRDSGKLKSLKQIQSNGKPESYASRLFSPADPNLLTEDIAYDAKADRFFLSSVHERKILSCTSTGNCEVFAANSSQLPLLGILALRVDSRRRILWATSVGMKAASNLRGEDDGRSALLKFDIETGKLLARFDAVEGKHALGDMTLDRNGTVYVADGLSGDVYILKPSDTRLEKLVPHGTFVSPQTPALSEDESLLYVPDYTMGISLVHLNDRQIEWLTSTVPAALDCIDGLYVVGGNNLLAVQNGTQPERIVSLHLQSPNKVDNVKVLEANWKGLGDPTHGVIVNDSFYFIVNSGWDRMDDDGKFAAGDPAEVWKLSLGKL